MLEGLKRRMRYRAYFEGFARACVVIEDLADKRGKENGIEVLVIARSTIKGLYAGEKERLLQREED